VEANSVTVRKPADIVLTIDCSSDMSSEIGTVKSTTSNFISNDVFLSANKPDSGYYPGQNNQIGLVAFNENISWGSLSSNATEVLNRISNPAPYGWLAEISGHRDTYSAVLDATSELSNVSFSNPNANKVMILITVGLPSDSSGGESDTLLAATKSKIDVAKAANIRVISIGLNMDTLVDYDGTQANPAGPDGINSRVQKGKDYIKYLASAPGDCYYVNSHPEQALPGCTSISAADLNGAMDSIYTNITAAIFNDLPPVVSVSKTPASSALFKTDKLAISAYASDIGFKNFYILWAKSADWASNNINKVDVNDLVGTVGEDGYRNISVGTGPLPSSGFFNEGDMIKYQVVAVDASNNTVKIDSDSPRSVNVATASLSGLTALYRNTNNTITLNVNDPDQLAYNGDDFYMTINSDAGSVANVKMTRVDNLNLSNPTYTYIFNPGCDWKTGYSWSGGGLFKQDANLNLNISINVVSSDVNNGQPRNLISSTPATLYSLSDEGIPSGVMCTNGLDDDCDYKADGTEIKDSVLGSAELDCDGTGPSASIFRTNPSNFDESAGSPQVYDNTNSITLNSQASDSSGLRKVIIYYNKNAGSPITAFTCTANASGKCAEDTSKDISNFSVTISGSAFPAAPGTVVNYYTQTWDNSPNNGGLGNQGNSAIKAFTVKSAECYGKSNLDACATTAGGKCCGNVCNASISNPSGYDTSCATQTCNGTVWQLVSDISKNGLSPCTTNPTAGNPSGNTNGCSAAVPSSLLYPVSYPPAFYASPSNYNPNGCENRTYTCNNGSCGYATNGTTQYDGCAAGTLTYKDFECSGTTCAENHEWSDAICDGSVDYSDLKVYDSTGINMTGAPEVLSNKTGQITFTASVADASGIQDYKIFWQVKDGTWQSKDCGSCGPTTLSSPCTCSQGVGPFSQGDFISYYLWAQDASSNHNVKYTAASGLNYKYYSYSSTGTDKKGTLRGVDVDNGVNSNLPTTCSTAHNCVAGYSWASSPYATLINHTAANSKDLWEDQAATTTVTWEGFIKPTAIGQYTFYVTADDEAKVYLNLNGSSTSTLVIDGLYGSATTGTYLGSSETASASYNITSLAPIPILIKWYNVGTVGKIQLGWTPPGGVKTYPIPSANLIAPYAIGVRDNSCYNIDSNYSSSIPSTAKQNISSTCNAGVGICCGGYCNPTAPSTSLFSSDCQVNSCSGLNWVYAASTATPLQNKNGNSCGSTDSCSVFYNGCQGSNICSSGLCVANPAGVKTDVCTGNVLTSHYGCAGGSTGACSLLSSNTDCSQSGSTGGCACNCGGYGRTEKMYSSLSLDGVDDYVNAGNGSSLNIPNKLTVSMWIYPKAEVVGYAAHPIGKWSTTTDANFVLYYFGTTSGTNRQIAFYANRGGVWGTIGAGYTLNLNTWYHVVLSYDSAIGGQLYINGNAVGGLSVGGVLATSTSSLLFGESASGTFNGNIDEVRIYNRALSSYEVKDLYNGIYNNAAGAPVGSWSFDGDSTGVVKDSSGNGNDGYVNSDGIFGAVNGTSFPAWTADRAGSSNRALSFDGTNGYINLNNLPVSTATGSKVSVEFWMKWNGNSGPMPFGWSSYDLYLNKYTVNGVANTPVFGFNTGSSDNFGILSAGLANTWVHVVAIFNNGDITQSSLYINGLKQAMSVNVGTHGTRTVSTNARISSWTNDLNYKFGGLIDEFRIYNRALTDVEVAQHYQGTYADESNLIRYWNFNEGSGKYVSDTSNSGLGQGPQWLKYYYNSSASVKASIANNVPTPWKVCDDSNKDNDCSGAKDGNELACDGQFDSLNFFLENSDSNDLFGALGIIPMKNSDVQTVSKNLTIEAMPNDGSGVRQTTIQWSTDNWTTINSKICGQTDLSTCKVCIQGGDCENFSTGTISAIGSGSGNNYIEDSGKMWWDGASDDGTVQGEWHDGRLQILASDGTTVLKDYHVSSNSLTRIKVDNWDSDGAPVAGAHYKVIKNSTLINPASLPTNALLKIKTCAWDRSTNNNSLCTPEKTVSIYNANEKPVLSNAVLKDPDFCADGLKYRLQWDFSDAPEANPYYNLQSSYEIQIKKSTTAWSDTDLSNIVDIHPAASGSHFYEINNNDPAFQTKFQLSYGINTYNWRVRATDNEDPQAYRMTSDWINGPDIVTKKYQYPQVNFSTEHNPDHKSSNGSSAPFYNCIVNPCSDPSGTCEPKSEDVCMFGVAIQFHSSVSVSVECQNDNDCQSSGSGSISGKVKCDVSTGKCLGCGGDGDCSSKFGGDWKCDTGTGVCSQKADAKCNANSNNCTARDFAKCDEVSDQCSACATDDVCKKFNTGDTYHCKDNKCIKYNTSPEQCYNSGSGCASCSSDAECRVYNNSVGRDYVCNEGTCEDYNFRQWFFNESKIFDSKGNQIPDSTEQNPLWTYIQSNTTMYPVELKVRDIMGNECPTPLNPSYKNITFEGKKYPKWNEVSSSDH